MATRTKTNKKASKNPFAILANNNRTSLRAARNRRESFEVYVKAHKRTMHTGYDSPEARALNLWEQAETVVGKLCRHADRNGVSASDRQIANRMISLIEDTFGG